MKYRNWGFGDGIWSHFTTTLLLMLILLVIFFVVAVTFNVFLRPVRKKSYLTKMFEKISAQISRLIAKLPMVFKELYKNLIIQKGVVIIALALLAPHIVYIIGVKIFGNLSIVRPLGFAYQYETTGATFKTFLPMIVMIVLALVSCVFTYKKVTK